MIKINFVGDVCLRNITNETYYFSNELYNIFENADLNVANLECVITDKETPLQFQPIHLKAAPSVSKIFDVFDVYTLANNHTMDYSEAGLVDTLKFLTSQNKEFFGAGLNKNEALKPLHVDVKGVKMAFIAFNRFNTAKTNKAGTAPEDINYICKMIKKLKKEGCFVVVYPHWNYQWIDYPAPDERAKGYKIIKAGADIIVGAHPHIVQGYERYREKMIFHSLGNFVFRNTKYSKPIPQFGKSFVLQLIINDDFSYEYKIIPVYNDNDGARLMTDEECKDFFVHMDKISSVLYNKKESHLLFYKNGKNIEKNNKFVFGELKKDGGYRAILENYRIANWQDVKRKLYTIFF